VKVRENKNSIGDEGHNKDDIDQKWIIVNKVSIK